MIQSARGAIEFNRNGDASCDPRGQAKKGTEAESKADTKNDGVGYGPGEQAQRAVLAAQQVIGEIKAPEHVKAGAGNADGCDRVMVHCND